MFIFIFEETYHQSHYNSPLVTLDSSGPSNWPHHTSFLTTGWICRNSGYDPFRWVLLFSWVAFVFWLWSFVSLWTFLPKLGFDGFLNCGKITCNKMYTLNIFKCIHNTVRPSPQSISRTLSSSQPNLCACWIITPHPNLPSPDPGNTRNLCCW